jgi:hypothetical protein
MEITKSQNTHLQKKLFDLSSEFKNLKVKYEAGKQELEEARALFEGEKIDLQQIIDDLKN